MDPSGTYVSCLAKAIGSASEGAELTLKEQYNKVRQLPTYRSYLLKLNDFQSISLDGAIKLALKILKEVMEEKISPANIDV